MEFFKVRRKQYFPWIKDFSDPQDKLRNANPKDLSWVKWFWFHPSAYNLIYISIPFLAAINFFAFTLLFNLPSIINIILTIFGVIMLYNGYKKTKQYPYTKNTSFYDTFIRDYR